MRQKVVVKLIPRIDLQALANKLVCSLLYLLVDRFCILEIHEHQMFML